MYWNNLGSITSLDEVLKYPVLLGQGDHSYIVCPEWLVLHGIIQYPSFQIRDIGHDLTLLYTVFLDSAITVLPSRPNPM